MRGNVSFADDRSNNNSRETLQCSRVVISSTTPSFLHVSGQNNKITHPKFIEYFEQISEFYGDWPFRVGVTSIYLPEICFVLPSDRKMRKILTEMNSPLMLISALP